MTWEGHDRVCEVCHQVHLSLFQSPDIDEFVGRATLACADCAEGLYRWSQGKRSQHLLDVFKQARKDQEDTRVERMQAWVIKGARQNRDHD